MADEVNIQKLREDFQKRFQSSPVDFFQKVIAPLLPQSMLGDSVTEMEEGQKQELIRNFLRDANLSMVGFDLDKSVSPASEEEDDDIGGNGGNGRH